MSSASITRCKQTFSNQCDTQHQMDQGLLVKCRMCEVRRKDANEIEKKVTTKESFCNDLQRFCLSLLEMGRLVTSSGHLVPHCAMLHARLELLSVPPPLCLQC
jgi:hypothetical protein